MKRFVLSIKHLWKEDKPCKIIFHTIKGNIQCLFTIIPISHNIICSCCFTIYDTIFTNKKTIKHTWAIQYGRVWEFDHLFLGINHSHWRTVLSGSCKTLYSIILHVVVVNINIEKVEICIKFQKVRLNEPKSFKTITKCTVESILFVRVNVCW